MVRSGAHQIPLVVCTEACRAKAGSLQRARPLWASLANVRRVMRGQVGERQSVSAEPHTPPDRLVVIGRATRPPSDTGLNTASVGIPAAAVQTPWQPGTRTAWARGTRPPLPARSGITHLTVPLLNAVQVPARRLPTPQAQPTSGGHRARSVSPSLAASGRTGGSRPRPSKPLANGCRWSWVLHRPCRRRIPVQETVVGGLRPLSCGGERRLMVLRQGARFQIGAPRAPSPVKPRGSGDRLTHWRTGPAVS